MIRADVKWVWALREGPGEDDEGARCAAGALRLHCARSPRAADRRPARVRGAERTHGAAAMPAPGRVPRRPWELAGATAGALQVCPRNVTFGGPWAGQVGRAQGARAAFGAAFVPGRWRSGACLPLAGHLRGSRSALLEFQRENSLSRHPALVTHREGRRGSCLVVLRIWSLKYSLRSW